MIKKVLKINAKYTEELPDSLQYTKERKPDYLKKITTDQGETFILHVEFQTADDPNMGYRMAEYLIMASREYGLPVRQYVVYIGDGKHQMNGKLLLGRSRFYYHLIELMSIDYRVFLRSKIPEEKMLAILADFGGQNPKTVIAKIATGVLKDANGELERLRRKKQFRILAQLRNLVSQNMDIMEHITSFFKEENDIFYKVGEKKGLEKGIAIGSEKTALKKDTAFVQSLLAHQFTIAEIANLANVSEAFVRKVKREMK